MIDTLSEDKMLTQLKQDNTCLGVMITKGVSCYLVIALGGKDFVSTGNEFSRHRLGNGWVPGSVFSV